MLVYPLVKRLLVCELKAWRPKFVRKKLSEPLDCTKYSAPFPAQLSLTQQVSAAQISL